jgi:hypothetical protein
MMGVHPGDQVFAGVPHSPPDFPVWRAVSPAAHGLKGLPGETYELGGLAGCQEMPGSDWRIICH